MVIIRERYRECLQGTPHCRNQSPHQQLFQQQTNSQVNGFVPVDDVAGEHKSLDVDHMNVASVGTNIEPLALEGQAYARDSAKRNETTKMHQW